MRRMVAARTALLRSLAVSRPQQQQQQQRQLMRLYFPSTKQGLPASAYFSTASSDSSSDLFDRTTQFMRSSDPSDGETIALLQEWKNAAIGSVANYHQQQQEQHEMVNSLLQHWLKAPSQKKQPRTTEPFLLALEAFRAHSNGPAAAAVLDQWGSLLGGDLELSPPLSAFHFVMEAYNRSEKVDGNDVDACTDLLQFLERSHMEGNYALEPTVETYAHVLTTVFGSEGTSWSNTSRKTKMETDLIYRLQEAFDAASASPTKLTPETCYHMIRGYSKAVGWGSNHIPSESNAWFIDFERNLFQSPDVLEKALTVPTGDGAHNKERVVSLLGKAYQSALRVLLQAQPSQLQYAQHAKDMLDNLALLKLEDLPWVEHFSICIQIWCADKDYEDIDPVLKELLHRFEDQHLVPPENTTHDTTRSTFRQLPQKIYSDIVGVWSRRGKVDEAEALLHHYMRLMQHKQIKFPSPKQVTRMWNYVMAGHLQEAMPQRTMELWDLLQDDDTVENDAYSYVHALQAIAQLNNHHTIQMATKVWDMLLEDPKVTPSALHYSQLILIWSRSSSNHAADKAAELLEELEARYMETGDESLKPLEVNYGVVLAALARNRRDRKAGDKAYAVFERMREHYQPDSRNYASLITSVSNGRSAASAERAEEILEEMELLVDDSPEGRSMKPNVYTYSAVVQAWAKSGSPDAPTKAAALVKRVEDKFAETGDIDLRPDAVTYGSLITTWSKSKRPDGGENAEAILQKMKDIEVKTGKTVLNAVVYTNVIMAHWKGGLADCAEKAEALLQEMKDRAANGDLDCIPDTITYTTAIQSWARSPLVDKGSHAWELLAEMCEEYKGGNMNVKPNVISFTACLNACAFTRGNYKIRMKAVEIALLAMNEFQSHKYDDPSQIMHLTLLKVFCRQIRDRRERHKFARIAFNRCCQDGQVDEAIIRLLHDDLPDLYAKLPRNQQQQVALPPEWTMNTRQRSQ